MANAAANTAGSPEKPGGPSIIVQVAVLLLMTGLAAGVGLFAGNYLNGERPAAPAGTEEQAGGHGGKAGEAEAAAPASGILPLPAILTNLAAPSETWIRVELAAVFDGQADPAVVDLIHQDLLAYLRTVKLHQVEGPSGFLHLKEDMSERAAIRSGGRIREILVRGMLIE